MLLTISTQHRPATDLGYLLHKHPERYQTFSQKFGTAHVFYPEANEDRCTAALLLEVDPIALVRGKKRKNQFALQQYVNDRPYVASSFLSVALADVFRTAMTGRCKSRPELVQTPIPLTVTLAVVPDASGGDLLKRMFEPLGYAVELTPHLLDPTFPQWGNSRAFTVRLSATIKLVDLLTHLYVLIPVLDNQKHYWVDEAEVEKLLRKGDPWLATHPEKELITRRYLRYRRNLMRAALERLMADEGEDLDSAEEAQEAAEMQLEKPISLHEQRLDAVLDVLKRNGARRVLDLGCGEGRLLQKLLDDPQFTEIVGVDISYRSLERAQKRLRLERLPEPMQERLVLLQGALTYQDERLAGYDAAALVEVIEHIELDRLSAFERVLFGGTRPSLIIITTPNAEYNVMFDTLPAGAFRHGDHRFEWTRAEFEQWASAVAERNGYTVECLPLGPEDPTVGAPSQIGVFKR